MYGAYLGRETPLLPDEADEVDAGDTVEGLGVDGWRRVRRVRRVEVSDTDKLTCQ